jgi:hypothetical protein
VGRPHPAVVAGQKTQPRLVRVAMAVTVRLRVVLAVQDKHQQSPEQVLLMLEVVVELALIFLQIQG